VYILGFLHVIAMLQSMRSSMKQLGHVLRSVKVTCHIMILVQHTQIVIESKCCKTRL